MIHGGRRLSSVWLALFLVLGCSVAPPRAEPAGQVDALKGSDSSAAAGARQRKAITIALPSDINALSTDLQQAGRNSLSSRYAHEFLTSYLENRMNAARVAIEADAVATATLPEDRRAAHRNGRRSARLDVRWHAANRHKPADGGPWG